MTGEAMWGVQWVENVRLTGREGSDCWRSRGSRLGLSIGGVERERPLRAQSRFGQILARLKLINYA
jgi:hypothetical protein